MIPQAIVSRSVSRAISAETTVDERASIWCLRHHGYASASQIVSSPASSSTRAVSSISSSGSIVSCMTPTRKGGATLAAGFRGRRGPLGLGLVALRGPRADALVGAARPARRLGLGGRLGRRSVVLGALGVRRLGVRRGLGRACRAGASAGRVPGADARSSRGSLYLAVERGEHVLHLLVDDRLQDALAHRTDGAEDLHVGRPFHQGG